MMLCHIADQGVADHLDVTSYEPELLWRYQSQDFSITNDDYDFRRGGGNKAKSLFARFARLNYKINSLILLMIPDGSETRVSPETVSALSDCPSPLARSIAPAPSPAPDGAGPRRGAAGRGLQAQRSAAPDHDFGLWSATCAHQRGSYSTGAALCCLHNQLF